MDRVRQRNFDLHQERIRKMRPQVDTRVPQVWGLDHLRNNLKREQMLEDRYYEIDRENRILLNKMSDIMKHATYSGDRSRSGPPSLNRDRRKQDLMRITQENRQILGRIQKAQPVYNHVEWEDSYQRSATYLRNSCEYPPTLMKRKGSRTNNLLPLRGRDSTSSLREDGYHGSRIEDMPDSAPGPSGEDLKYVLNQHKRIGQKHYLVEMATDGRTLAISAYDADTKTTLELLVNDKNHRRLYREANGDYNMIADKLRVDGNQLILEMTGPYEGAISPT